VSRAAEPRPSFRLSFRWTLALVFLLALGVRCLYLVDSRDHPGFKTPIVDASFYDLAARQLAGSTGEGAARDDGDGTLRSATEARLYWQPFLYPRIIAAVYALGGSILTLKGLQALVGALTAAGTFWLGVRRLGYGPGLGAGVAVALYGPLVLFEGELLAAGWAAFAAVALLLLLDRAGERIGDQGESGEGGAGKAKGESKRGGKALLPGVAWGAVLGAASALAVLLRPTFLPFVLAGGLWLAWRARRAGDLRALATSASALAVGFAALTLPVAFAARPVTGSFSFLPTSGPLNLYLGNSEDLCATLTIRPGAEWGELLDRPKREGLVDQAGQQRYFRRQVLDLARERPGVFLRNQGAKTLRFVSSRELPRNLDVYLWRQWSAVLSALTWKVGPWGFPFGLLLPLAMVGVMWSWRRLGTPLVLFLVLYPLAVIAVFVSARYRVPVVPALAVAAAAGGEALLGAIRGRRWRRVAAMAGVVVGAVLLGTLPGPFCEEELPAAADFWRNLGSAQEQRGESEAAEESYRQSLAAYAKESGEHRRAAWEVHLNLGRRLAARGEVEEAISHYRQATALAPEQGDALYNLGLLLLGRGAAPEAAAAFTEAARREPELPRVQVHRARALTAAGRPEEALEAAREAVRRTPRDPQARFALGGLLLNRSRPEEAVQELERALELARAQEPGVTAEIHNELGTALIALGRPREAVEQYESALTARPDYVEALTNLGAVLAMGGALPEAQKRFARAVELRPRDPVARFNLALVLEGLGQTAAAREELRRVLEIDPDYEPARRRLEGLAGEGSP